VKYLFKYAKLFFSAIKDSFLNSLYYISKIIPKKKKLWVFGSSLGLMFKDNSKYMFLYMHKHLKSQIKVVWIATNKALIEELQSNGFKAYYKWSFKGIINTLRAKVVIVSHGLNDVNQYLASGFTVNLWHGVPLKKIGYANLNPNSFSYRLHNSKGLRRFYYQIVCAGQLRKSDRLLATTEIYANIFVNDFEYKRKNILIGSYPRNDFLVERLEGEEIGTDRQLIKIIKQKIANGAKILLYMPTFRDTGDSEFDDIFNIPKLNKALEDANALLVIKSHISSTNTDEILKYDNIMISQLETDPQPLLNFTDILVTDYSSVFYDFLYFDRPIIFYAYDLEKYQQKDREMYYDFEAIAPGKIVKTFSEFVDVIKETIKNPVDGYSDIRQDLLKKTFLYTTGSSSKRIFELVVKKNKIN